MICISMYHVFFCFRFRAFRRLASSRRCRERMGHRSRRGRGARLPSQLPERRRFHRGLQCLFEKSHECNFPFLHWPYRYFCTSNNFGTNFLGRDDGGWSTFAAKGRGGFALRRTPVPRLQRHEPIQFASVLAVQELPRGVVSLVLRLLQTAVFHHGERAEFRDVQEEHGAEVDPEVPHKDGLSVHVWNTPGGKLRCSSDTKEVRDDFMKCILQKNSRY